MGREFKIDIYNNWFHIVFLEKYVRASNPKIIGKLLLTCDMGWWTCPHMISGTFFKNDIGSQKIFNWFQQNINVSIV